ncbi:Gfo/Idh/MocA family protein [Cohnella sp.]|uniref:Gfo/Idh/MocA family protein n=1 Tax=Cohnella sp. TaxID=1883426 RepID=UPI00356A84F6
MNRVGFIDYFLDEWHANHYPLWIEQASGGTMKVTCAYGEINAPNGRDNAAWCRDMGIELLPTIEAVIESSEYLIVLSPDHPEFHEELALLPLQSGKPTYVDKTFARDRETASKMFEWAAKHNTPLYSSSALRFAPEYKEVRGKAIDTLCSQGPGKYANYGVHQIEPIVSLMGPRAKRVMSIGTILTPALLIDFPDGRQATLHHIQNSPFLITLQFEGGHSARITAEADFFAAFIDNLEQFFRTGISTVDPEETIAVITLIEYGLKAMQTPYEWIELPGSISI